MEPTEMRGSKLCGYATYLDELELGESEDESSLYAISFEDDENEESDKLIPIEPPQQSSKETQSRHLLFTRTNSMNVIPSDNTAQNRQARSQSFHGITHKMDVESRVRSSKDLIWIQQYNPRTKQYYYVNPTTGECMGTRPRFVSKAKMNNSQHLAALVIQCAIRSYFARQRIAQRRAIVPPSRKVDAIVILHEAYDRKCKRVHELLDRLAQKISYRQISATHLMEDGNHVAVQEFVKEFQQSWDHIQSTFAAAQAVIDENQDLLLHRLDEINSTLNGVQNSCRQLQKIISSHEDAFLAQEAQRVNSTWRQFLQWSAPHERLMKVFHRVEGHLRRTMGTTSFNSGVGLQVAKMSPRAFDEWHVQVEELINSAQAYEELIARENSESTPDETSISSGNNESIRPVSKPRDRKQVYDVAYLQQCWKEGLDLRKQDLDNQAQSEREDARSRAIERMKTRTAQEKFRNERDRRKLSIWEAVIEGWSEEKIDQLAIAETKKASQNGAEAFRLRDSQSENGRTLLQLAVWWGHTHLVRYLVEKGSNVGQFDCVNNRFSLLHDAARAGHPEVIHLLLEYGLPANILDKYGDTPVHWAARRNNINAINMLLGLPLKEMPTPAGSFTSQDITRWKSVLTSNHRGKRPIHLTTLRQLRNILADFERVAETGLEYYNRRGAGEAAMLKRRDGLAPIPSTMRRAPTPLTGSTQNLLRQRTSRSSDHNISNCEVPIDDRRQKEFRVKKATAKAVRNFEKEGQKHANVATARSKFLEKIHSKSSFVIETEDMDIFMDTVESDYF